MKAQSVNFPLYYETHGDGPAVIFVHGSGGNHLSWWQQLPNLSRDFRCITFDHRGFGLSENTPQATQASFTNDVCKLLDHLNIEKAHLVGQSLGGRTCLDFALSNPDRVSGLVLAGTLGGISDAAFVQALAKTEPPPNDLFERALSSDFRRKQRDFFFLYQQIEALNRARPVPSISLAEGPTSTDLAKLRIPTLFIVGMNDPVARPEMVTLAAQFIVDARCEIVPDAGHSVYFERPESFNRLVSEFLAPIALSAKGPR